MTTKIPSRVDRSGVRGPVDAGESTRSHRGLRRGPPRRDRQVLRSLARIGELAALLSHEVRTTPSGLQLALYSVGDAIGLNGRELVDGLVANIDLAENLLAQALAFARPLELDRHLTAPAALIADVVAQSQSIPVVQTMDVAVECAGRLPDVAVDQQLMSAALVGLLHNAGAACDGRGHVALTARSAAGRLVIEVADDGPGVSSERRAELFRPFHGAKVGGNCIDLALCRKIIEAHGGSLELEEQTTVGARFRVELDGFAAR